MPDQQRLCVCFSFFSMDGCGGSVRLTSAWVKERERDWLTTSSTPLSSHRTHCCNSTTATTSRYYYSSAHLLQPPPSPPRDRHHHHHHRITPPSPWFPSHLLEKHSPHWQWVDLDWVGRVLCGQRQSNAGCVLCSLVSPWRVSPTRSAGVCVSLNELAWLSWWPLPISLSSSCYGVSHVCWQRWILTDWLDRVLVSVHGHSALYLAPFFFSKCVAFRVWDQWFLKQQPLLSVFDDCVKTCTSHWQYDMNHRSLSVFS